MKIVYVAEWNPLTGGAFTVVTNLINNMLKAKYGADIHIVSFGEKDEIIYEDGYTIHFIEYTDFPTARYWYLPKLLKNKILEINPDLIHLHFTYPPYSFVAQLHIPLIITTHGLSCIRIKGAYSKRNYINLRFILDPYFEKLALKNADNIIVVSDWIRKKVDSIIGVNSKTIYIPNGIDYNKYENIEDIQSINHPSILIMGRLIKLKGIDILIRALPIVKKSVPNIHLYIAGEGIQQEKLKSLTAKLNIKENVTFLGHISGNEKTRMLSSVDVFAITSRYETFGIVVLEALASGTPIIASNVGGIPHILNYGEYGILVDPENPEDLANGIIKLIEDPALRKELREKGRKRAQEYSWDEITKKTVELYQSLV